MPKYGDWPSDMERYFTQLSRMGKRPTIVFTEYQHPAAWTPALDMYETEDALVVVLELAGVDPQEADIQAEPGRLFVRGIRRERMGPDNGRRSYHALEIPRGAFERSLPLPSGLNTDDARASYHDGLLEIHIPRRSPHQVKISVESQTSPAEEAGEQP